MTDREKLSEIVERVAQYTLPMNTDKFHLDMLVNMLIANGVKAGKDTSSVGCADTFSSRRRLWIPVTERLPEKGGNYIVHHKSGLVTQRHYYRGEGEIFVNVRNNPVTHWMPLPEPPKEGDV